MKKYNPVFYNKTIWSDQRRTKNTPSNCKRGHSFCHFQYEWGDHSNTIQQLNNPINTIIPNVTLPISQQKIINVKYQNMTQEQLDDWIAQSTNRTLDSMLNPNKKYYLPSKLEEQFKVRYLKRRKKLSIQSDDTYFKTKRSKSQQKSYLTTQKKNTLDLNQIIYDYKKLQPKSRLGNNFISYRQNQNKSSLKKSQIYRRNAVLLDKDIHYQRFLEQNRKMNKVENQNNNMQKQKEMAQKLKKFKMYMYNFQSLKRRTPKQPAPNSIIQYEGVNLDIQQRVFQLEPQGQADYIRQEEKQQFYRLKGNQKAEKALQKMSGRQRKSSQKKSINQKLLSKQVSYATVHQIIGAHFTNRTSKKSQRKKLGQKAYKLLQQMQVQAENIDIKLAKFDVHIDYIPLINVQYQSISQRWIIKGESQIKKKKLDLALDCYKQAIIIQPEYFIPILNLAAILQRQNMFNQSLKWLHLAKQFQTDRQKVSFGISLIYFKQQKFRECYNQIKQLIDYLIENKNKVELKYYYMLALCHKRFGEFFKATQNYKIIQQTAVPSNYNYFSNFIFSIVFARKRRLLTLVDGLSYVKCQQTLFTIFYQNEKKVKEQNQSLIQIKETISNFRFFKRFSTKLIEKILSCSKYEIYKKNQLIFLKQQECFILLSGLISMKNHQKNLMQPQITGVLRQGDFFGVGKIQNNRSQHLNTWLITSSDTQIIKMHKKQFQSLWNGQITFDLDFKYNFIKNIRLFDHLSEATLFKICQLMQQKTFPKGTILFNDCGYRYKTLNKLGQGFSLVKNNINMDERFLRVNFKFKQEQKQREKRTYKIAQLLKKYIFKFNEMKFNRIKFPGLYIVVDGIIEIEDDRGFRCSDAISSMDYFGESLIINCDGFHNYGRLKVYSQTAKVYLLSLQNIIWCFTSEDKQIMKKNGQNQNNTKSLNLIKNLRSRHQQCKELKNYIGKAREKLL